MSQSFIVYSTLINTLLHSLVSHRAHFKCDTQCESNRADGVQQFSRAHMLCLLWVLLLLSLDEWHVNLINICCKSPLTIVQLKYKCLFRCMSRFPDGPDNMALTVNGQNTTSFSAGSNLTILCSSQSNPPAQLQWAFRGELVNVTGPLLELSHVGEDQSGPYSCLAFNNYTNMHDNITTHIIIASELPISNVTLWAKETNLVEYNDTAVLMCSVSNGSSLSFEWLDGNSTVTAGGQVLLSNGNATLTILNVTHHYQGPFRCKVSNGISHEISAPVHLNISYGPSNTTMMITPMKDTYKTGSKITLSCSAESSPPAMIKWIVDGVYLNQSGPQLQLENVTQGNSGHYTCVLHNTVTSRFSSASAMIQVLGKVGIVVFTKVTFLY
uniref:Ig-like domain-containing protein n=1 Tax=Amphiprion ocellaris TaxID=80972 RepID=A0AAQ5X9C7_AMPOC